MINPTIDQQEGLRRELIESPNEWVADKKIDEKLASIEREELFQLDGRLESRGWRLNNLYWIEGEDDDGQRVVMRFRMNWAQSAFYSSLWWLCCILKVRQLGFSTFIALFALDDVLFNLNHKAGIIDKTDGDAKKKLLKCRFAYDNLNREDPDNEDLVAIGSSIKKSRPLIPPTNDHTMSFGGESKGAIWAGTSFRGDTAQVLHVSELGYTAHYFPRKAEEVMAGATNAVHKGNHIFVESTFEGGKVGEFYDLILNAMGNASRSFQELTPMDWKFFFFTWWKHPEYRLSEDAEIPALRDFEAEYYKKLRKSGVLLTRGQIAWHVRKWRSNREAMLKEFPTTVSDCLNARLKGAIYGDECANVRESGRIIDIAPDLRYPIHTSWDLGYRDFMVIWVWQMVGPQIRILRVLEGTQQKLSYYLNWLKDLRDEEDIVISTHYLPHDAAAHSRGGRSFMDELFEAGVDNVVKVPVTPDVWVGINVLRELFPNIYFDASTEYTWKHKGKNYVGGFLALEAYVQAEDASSGAIRPVPVKNQAAHAADGLRTMAEAYAQNLITDAPAGKPKHRARAGKPKVKGLEHRQQTPNGTSSRRRRPKAKGL